MAKDTIKAEIALDLNPKLTKEAKANVKGAISQGIQQLSQAPTAEAQAASKKIAKSYQNVLNRADKIFAVEMVGRGRGRKKTAAKDTDILQDLYPGKFPKALKGFEKTTRAQFQQVANLYRTLSVELNKDIVANAPSISRGETLLGRLAEATPKITLYF